MGLRDLFNRNGVEIKSEELDLHLEGINDHSQDFVSREKALSLPSVYANVELIKYYRQSRNQVI